MKASRPSVRTVWRYVLFQVPSVTLLGASLALAHLWLGLPRWVVWTTVALWIIKDIALFPFLWRSYSTDRRDEANSLAGERGTAREHLSPSGRVQIRGEIWQAELLDRQISIGPGEAIRVRDVKGLTLLVEPDRPSGPP